MGVGVGGDDDGGQGGAFVEQIVSDGSDAVGDSDACQGTTHPECRLSDGGDAVRNDYRSRPRVEDTLIDVTGYPSTVAGMVMAL